MPSPREVAGLPSTNQTSEEAHETNRGGAPGGLWRSTTSSVGLGSRPKKIRPSSFSRVFASLHSGLVRWTRGRLPRWARGRVDTDDLVQEAFFGLFRRLPHLDPMRRGALQAYLRRSIQNRVRDEVRRAGSVEVQQVESDARPASGASPLEATIAHDDEQRFRCALATLPTQDQELIVGRLDLGYSYEQLALACSKASADAARVAVRRALLKLAEQIGEC